MRRHEDPEREVCRGCGFPVGACECGSLRDDAPGYGDSPEDPTERFDGQYVTEAVESVVLDADGEEVGHVGLLDVDDAGLGGAVETAHRLPGPVAVLRSSTDSYHVWSLAVDTLDGWLDRVVSTNAADSDHVALSAQRDCAVLRLDAKVEVSTGEEVRPAPSLSRVVDGSTDLPLSRPHADLLADEFGLDLDALLDGREWVGHSTERRVYMADIGGREEGDD